MASLSKDNSPHICCYGEILFRFSPQLQGKFIEQSSMSVYVGGAELNVATALANWHLPVSYVSAMPDNYLSKEIIISIAQKNIDTAAFIFSGDRIGSYYLPQGADLKNSGVIYDRANSSFANLKPGTLNWDEILNNASWFHFSAITPALNTDAAAVCLEGVKAAAAKNIPISVDLNHRAKLWQYGKQPVEVMPELVQYCTVIMGNLWAAQTLLGINTDQDFHKNASDKKDYLQHANDMSNAIMQQYPSCTTVANTFRFDDREGIQYFASLDTKQGQSSSSTYATQSIVDKVGSGDCFMGGLIYGLSQQHSPKNIIEFAAAAAFGKLQQIGDATTSSVEDIQKIIKENE